MKSTTKPTVFISAATIDLLYLRDLLAAAFTAAQFHVLVRGEGPSAPQGTLRDTLVKDIAQSDCVIHLAGIGYGGDANQPFPAHPDFRCSWPQFEYYHAHATGRQVIGFVCAPDLSYFKKEEKGDAEERALKTQQQREHRERIASGGFQGTPLAGLMRTVNMNLAPAESINAVLMHISRMIGTLLRQGHPAIAQIRARLQQLCALHTLPPPPQGFIGREAELKDLRALAGQDKAVIIGLKGMGGIGKTTLARVLAREWAPRYPDAGLLLDGKGLIGDAPSATMLMEQVILAFQHDAKLPDAPAALAQLYRSVLHGKKALILLENARDSAQVQPLLPPDGCALIVTTCADFTLDDSVAYNVGRMNENEAAQVLRNAYPKLPDAEMQELIRLCAGRPLALRLVASHLALDAADHAGLADVVGYLWKFSDDRLAHLNPEEAQETTIEEILHLSEETLSEPQKRAWRKLSIFTTSFRTEAAAAIAGADQDMLASFLRHSLLEADGADRYRLHDLAANYARQSLTAKEVATLVLSHAAHYTAIADEANALCKKDNPSAGPALFDRERPQIEAAWKALAKREGEPDDRRMIALVDSLVHVSHLRFHPKQRIEWLEARLRAAHRVGHREAQGSALDHLGLAHAALGDARTAIGYQEQYLEIVREIGDRSGECSALCNLGNAHADLGDVRTAIGYHEQALALSREIGDWCGEGNSLGNLGNAHYSMGDARTAISYYEQQLEITCEIGDPRGEGNAFWNSALAYDSLGERAEAVTRAEAALAVFEDIKHPAAAMAQRQIAEWTTLTPSAI